MRGLRNVVSACFYWSRLSESNRQPSDYKSDALPIELKRLTWPGAWSSALPERAASPGGLAVKMPTARFSVIAPVVSAFTTHRACRYRVSQLTRPFVTAFSTQRGSVKYFVQVLVNMFRVTVSVHRTNQSTRLCGTGLAGQPRLCGITLLKHYACSTPDQLVTTPGYSFQQPP